MKIFITSVFVEDQQKALKFYTGVLGFVKKADVSVNNYQWLTVVSAEGLADVELLLEPNANPAAKEYQKAIHDAGTPATMFKVDDIQKEHTRLVNLGVKFTMPLTRTGPSTTAFFDDTCGNIIAITQQGN